MYFESVSGPIRQGCPAYPGLGGARRQDSSVTGAGRLESGIPWQSDMPCHHSRTSEKADKAVAVCTHHNTCSAGTTPHNTGGSDRQRCDCNTDPPCQEGHGRRPADPHRAQQVLGLCVRTLATLQQANQQVINPHIQTYSRIEHENNR